MGPLHFKILSEAHGFAEVGQVFDLLTCWRIV